MSGATPNQPSESFVTAARRWLAASATNKAIAVAALVVAAALGAVPVGGPPAPPPPSYEVVRVPGTDVWKRFDQSNPVDAKRLHHIHDTQRVLLAARKAQMERRERGEEISPDLSLIDSGESLPLPAERAILRERGLLAAMYVYAGMATGEALVTNAAAGAVAKVLPGAGRAIAAPILRRAGVATPIVEGATREIAREGEIALAEQRAARELERKATEKAATGAARDAQVVAETVESTPTKGLVGALEGAEDGAAASEKTASARASSAQEPSPPESAKTSQKAPEDPAPDEHTSADSASSTPEEDAGLPLPKAAETRPPGQLKLVGNNTWESRAGLRYGSDKNFGNRVQHVLNHAGDLPNRSAHGVFDGGREGVLSVVDEAYGRLRAGVPGLKSTIKGNRTEFVVPMGRRIGYLGGTAGAARGHPPADHVLLVLEGDRDVITAYPFIPGT